MSQYMCEVSQWVGADLGGEGNVGRSLLVDNFFL